MDIYTSFKIDRKPIKVKPFIKEELMMMSDMEFLKQNFNIYETDTIRQLQFDRKKETLVQSYMKEKNLQAKELKKKKVYLNIETIFRNKKKETEKTKALEKMSKEIEEAAFIKENYRVDSPNQERRKRTSTIRNSSVYESNRGHSQRNGKGMVIDEKETMSEEEEVPLFISSMDNFFKRNIIEEEALVDREKLGLSPQKNKIMYKKQRRAKSRADSQARMEYARVMENGQLIWKDVPVKNLFYYKDLLPKTLDSGHKITPQKLKSLSCTSKGFCRRIKSGELGEMLSFEERSKNSHNAFVAEKIKRKCSIEYNKEINSKTIKRGLKQQNNFKENMKRKIKNLLKPIYKDKFTEKLVAEKVVDKQKGMGVFLYGKETNCYDKHKKIFFKINTKML